MTNQFEQSLAAYLTALADDELILGHRDSEWCGHAPILEEDIAFANLALDEIGHAQIYYQIVAQLKAEDPDTYPDWLVFERPADQFRNLVLVELPKGDWAFSMLRRYLYDSAEMIRLKALHKSKNGPLAQAAGVILREEHYHLRHTRAWIKRLGLGTQESHDRLQNALDELWPYTSGLFCLEPDQVELVEREIVPGEHIQADWQKVAVADLTECGLTIPASPPAALPRGQHTRHFAVLIADMQSVARLDPQATW